VYNKHAHITKYHDTSNIGDLNKVKQLSSVYSAIHTVTFNISPVVATAWVGFTASGPLYSKRAYITGLGAVPSTRCKATAPSQGITKAF